MAQKTFDELEPVRSGIGEPPRLSRALLDQPIEHVLEVSSFKPDPDFMSLDNTRVMLEALDELPGALSTVKRVCFNLFIEFLTRMYLPQVSSRIGLEHILLMHSPDKVHTAQRLIAVIEVDMRPRTLMLMAHRKAGHIVMVEGSDPPVYAYSEEGANLLRHRLNENEAYNEDALPDLEFLELILASQFSAEEIADVDAALEGVIVEEILDAGDTQAAIDKLNGMLDAMGYEQED